MASVSVRRVLFTVKTSELQEQLLRCRGDLEVLKNEREMMISAHQDQIEQLRESFKRKMAGAES